MPPHVSLNMTEQCPPPLMPPAPAPAAGGPAPPAPPWPPPNWLHGNVVGRADPGEAPAVAPEDDPDDALPEDAPPEAPDDEPLELLGDDEAPEEDPSAEPPSSVPVLAIVPPHDPMPNALKATAR